MKVIKMLCDACVCKPVCDKFKATGGVNKCEHHQEDLQGEWKYYHKQNIAVCTNCSFERDLNMNIGRAIACPNCGAKIIGAKIV